ncbi:MAG TPA: HYR domain-containing protein [Chryseosolibacter sp.]
MQRMLNHLKATFIGLTLVAVVQLSALGQACMCPEEISCKPCSGGYTSLTLRYNGTGAATVFIKDGLKILLDASLSPLEQFTISGSRNNEKFADRTIPVLIDGLPNTMLGPRCDDVKVGLTYGAFTVIAAQSIGGSVVCCSALPPDRVPPQISNVPPDMTVSVSNACSATVEWDPPLVIDNCAVQSLTSNHLSGDSFALGRTTVTYTATDEAGLTTTASFNIYVVDNTNPVFQDGPAQDVHAVANESCSAIVSWVEPRVSDNCAILLKQSHKPNTAFPVGKTLVIYKATDASGNTSTFSFNVIVQDKSLALMNCPPDIYLTTDEDSFVNASWVAPTASRICEEVTLRSTHKPGDQFSTGTTVVEYTATTSSGRHTSCEFNVVVTLEQKLLEVSKLLTPDGDGMNDDWFIHNIENYRDNQVLIFDRWGGVIFQASRYDNESIVWRGTNKSGGAVPTGTYFYTITASDGARRIHTAGAVELVR